jgi:hypothetical protein
VAEVVAPVAIEKLPASQSVQASSPRVGLYVPVPHGTHDDTPARWYPYSQVQFPEKLERTADHMLGGHGFLTPVQHHDPSSHAVHGVFSMP